MADNINITEGSGKTFRTHEEGGVHRQVHHMEPSTRDGCETYRNVALSTTGFNFKAEPGQVYGWDVYNPHATDIAYVKLYDNAGTPTSSDTPKRTIMVPAKGGCAVSKAAGITFTTGIAARASKNAADNDNTAPTTALIVNIDWK